MRCLRGTRTITDQPDTRPQLRLTACSIYPNDIR